MTFHPALLLFALSACESSSEREVGTWTSVDNESSAQLRLSWEEPDARSSASVSVHCPGNTAIYVETVVEDDTLYVRAEDEVVAAQCEVEVPAATLRHLHVSGDGAVVSDATLSKLESIEVTGQGNVELAEVTSPALDVRIRGGGNVLLGWLEVDSTTIDLAGNGSMEAAGRVPEGTLEISGTGDFHGADLVFDHLVARLSGSGNAEINVTGSADIVVSGSGSVTVFGDGEVYALLKGSGTVDTAP